MVASDFNKLSIDEKGNLLTEHSLFLDERVIYGKYKIIIYSLFNFYVEVYYHAVHNEIETVTAIETSEDWESYLKSINLNSLLSP